MGEAGGLGLNAALNNNSISHVDPIGLQLRGGERDSTEGLLLQWFISYDLRVTEFLYHYVFGRGRTLDISGHPMLSEFRSRISHVRDEVKHSGQAAVRPDCNGEASTFVEWSGEVRSPWRITGAAGNWIEAFTDVHMVLNQGSEAMRVRYECNGTLECECCSQEWKPLRLDAGCRFYFSLRDMFQNPRDRHGSDYVFVQARYDACKSDCTRRFGPRGGKRYPINRVEYHRCLKDCRTRNPPSEEWYGTPYLMVADWIEDTDFIVEYGGCNAQ